MKNESAAEAARLDALHKLHLLDTPQNDDFDRLTRLAAKVFALPIAAVSLTDRDRQWFKSRVGVAHVSIPRDKAPCAQVAETARYLVVTDLLKDPYFQDSHLARSGIRFYAGVPLVTSDGYGLGSMCVLGFEPRIASNSELSALADLAALTMQQIEFQHALGRTDPITGMPNRTQLIEDLEDLAKDSPFPQRRLLVMVDLAGADQLSSTLRVMGASYVDDILLETARILQSVIGEKRKIYHVAQTQFVFLASEGSKEDIYSSKVASVLNKYRGSTASRLVTTVTVGIAPFIQGDVDHRDVLRMAHSAAQDALLNDSHVSIYSPGHDVAYRRRFELLHEFGRALEDCSQFRLVYQPRIELTTGRCVGAEALLRWTHPVLGDISPGEFIPLVEHTSMTKSITAWVIQEALKELARWQSFGLSLRISVNISAANLLESDFSSRLDAQLRRYGADETMLEIEVTESALMANPRKAHQMLKAIGELGVKLAIDDFGTGYSSLSYLQTMPVDVVKIDRSFIRGVLEDGKRRLMLSTMISLCHDLGHKVVAEGIETEEVALLLKDLNCEEAQGYYFSHPLPSIKFIEWINANRKMAA
jgi:EAL domain-containing protein (putative c-di-GMP-specific phosphodiesterase class I)/GGDEF domain-containing protein